jgi:hypothetical protein
VSNRVTAVERRGRILLEPKWWLVVYTVFDLVWTWIRVQRLVEESTAADMSLIRAPLALMADSLLLLVAVAGLWLRKPWNFLVVITGSGLLFYLGFEKWRLIASAIEAPLGSWAVLRYWWSYGSAEWDFPRLVVGAVVLLYSAISLSRYPRTTMF